MIMLMKGLHNGVPFCTSTWATCLGCFPNIQVLPLDLDLFLWGTPLAAWHSGHTAALGALPAPLCPLTLSSWFCVEHQGIYLDMDFIILPSPEARRAQSCCLHHSTW